MARSTERRPRSKRIFVEALGALGVAITFFMAGFTVRGKIVEANSPEESEAHGISEGLDEIPDWLMDFFRSYVSPRDLESYMACYSDFVKPYYSWPGGATTEQIRQEHERYLRAYDVTDMKLLDVEPQAAEGSESGIQLFVLTCRRVRKHRDDQNIARSIVRIAVTLDANPRPPQIVGVRTLDQ